MSLDQTFQSGIQRENMYLRTVETTRPWPRRGLVRRELRLERYRSTGRCSLRMWQGKSWKNHDLHLTGLPGRAIWDSA